MKNILINGKNKEFDNMQTLSQIIKELEIEDKVMAAALNMNIVKKENWSSCIPNDNDKLELLEFVGGG